MSKTSRTAPVRKLAAVAFAAAAMSGSAVADTYAKLVNGAFEYYSDAECTQSVEAPATGLAGVTVLFADNAEYQALAARANELAESTVALQNDITLTADADWRTIDFDMNGKTVTLAGTDIYAGQMNYSGDGKIVIATNALFRSCMKSATAGGCDVEVYGVLGQQDGMVLSPVKSLVFAEGGKYHNLKGTPADVTVYETYAPNVEASAGSTTPHPIVHLGAAEHLETTLDLSRWTGTLDDRETGYISFEPGSTVTIDHRRADERSCAARAPLEGGARCIGCVQGDAGHETARRPCRPPERRRLFPDRFHHIHEVI